MKTFYFEVPTTGYESSQVKANTLEEDLVKDNCRNLKGEVWVSKLEEWEFDEQYSIILEDLTNSIKDRLDIEFTDHALYRLCRQLELELQEGENKYE